MQYNITFIKMLWLHLFHAKIFKLDSVQLFCTFFLYFGCTMDASICSVDFLVGGKKFVGVKETRDKVRTRYRVNLLCFVKEIKFVPFFSNYVFFVVTFTSYPTTAVMYHISQTKRNVMVLRPNLMKSSLSKRLWRRG